MWGAITIYVGNNALFGAIARGAFSVPTDRTFIGFFCRVESVFSISIWRGVPRAGRYCGDAPPRGRGLPLDFARERSSDSLTDWLTDQDSLRTDK